MNAGFWELGDQRSGVVLAPAAARFRDDVRAVVFHLGDKSTGSARALMARGPDQKIEKDWREIDTLPGQAVIEFSGVGGRDTRGDNSGFGQSLETAGEDVGSDAFTGLLELLKGAQAANHEIANDQKGPAVAEHLQRNTHRAAGPALPGASKHSGSFIKITCEKQASFRGEIDYF